MKIQNPDPQTLVVSGLAELAAANAPSFRDKVRSLIQPATRLLEIDLSQTGFLDSSGLGALISLHKTMRQQEGNLRLRAPTTPVRQILELTRLHRLFEITEG